MQFEADGKTNGPGIRWPGGARVAVMLTFDFDAEFLRISRAESKEIFEVGMGFKGPVQG